MSKTHPITVTRPSLPELSSLLPYLRDIWDSRVLSNGGKYSLELEHRLESYFGVSGVSLFNNGTNALITALQALDISGEVLTTPFSFVATSNALLWNKLTPVFVDICPDTLNINPDCLEKYITANTSAILAVHCYGTPCDTTRINQIANKHGLRVIYDAAHAFGVEDEGGSILRHGDLSVLSFHATKVFNTFEGGAIVSSTIEMKARIGELRNFGFNENGEIREAGINGKMNEFSAALGILQLSEINMNLHNRERADRLYREALDDIKGIQCLPIIPGVKSNYSYFPVIVEDSFGCDRDTLVKALAEMNVFARAYFSPLISDFQAFSKFNKDETPVARDVSRRVLCLPMYADISSTDIEHVISAIKGASL